MVLGLAGSAQVSDAIVVVDIDDNSLDHYGQWPWPRSLLAELLQSIHHAGAVTIGVDLLLAEPDRYSSTNSSPDWHHQTNILPDLGDGATDLRDNDLVLADILSKGPNVLGYNFLFQDTKKKNQCQLHPPGMVWVNVPSLDEGRNGFSSAGEVICSRSVFTAAVTSSGFVNAAPDNDGVLRRIPLLMRFDGQVYPSLILAMLMKQAGSKQIVVQPGDYGQLSLRVGNRSIAIDALGNMLVRFTGSVPTIARLSALDIFRNDIAANTLRDKFVIVGFSASGMQQVYQTPAGPVQLHSTVHAQALNTLLSDQQMYRTRVFLLWEVLFSLFIAMAVSLSVARCGIVTSAATGLLLVALCWAGSDRDFQDFRTVVFAPVADCSRRGEFCRPHYPENLES